MTCGVTGRNNGTTLYHGWTRIDTDKNFDANYAHFHELILIRANAGKFVWCPGFSRPGVCQARGLDIAATFRLKPGLQTRGYGASRFLYCGGAAGK